MSDYIVSARKYRPDTFHSVVGQQALTTTLKNAIKEKKLAHAYLFCGPRGVGKTSCARIFAKTVNCLNRTAEGEACNQCESCRSYNEQRAYNVIELDAASNNTVDDIRNLIEQVRIPPMTGQYRVYIIDEVHMLSTQAFNAFLKTLEEPPAHAIFVLATTDKHKVLPTIISRCQVYDFNRILAKDIADHLAYVASQEGIQAERDALELIAVNADGGMRDALSIFDQVAGFGQGNISYQGVIENLSLIDEGEYFKMLAFMAQGLVSQLLLQADALIRRGYDPLTIIGGYATFLRNVLMSKTPQTLALVETTESLKARYAKAAEFCKVSFIWNAIKIATDFEAKYREAGSKRLALEVALIRMAEPKAPEYQEGLTPQVPTATAGVSVPPTTSTTPQNSAPQPQEEKLGEPAQQAQRIEKVVGELSVKQQAKTNSVTTSLRSRMSISLNNNANQQEPETAPKELRNNAYSMPDFQSAWRGFTAQVQDNVFLKQTLQDFLPQKREGDLVTIEVPTRNQAEIIQQTEGELMTFLANKLSNDHIRLQIKVVAQKAQSLPVSAREKFAYFEKKTPAFKQFVTHLGLVPRM